MLLVNLASIEYNLHLSCFSVAISMSKERNQSPCFFNLKSLLAAILVFKLKERDVTRYSFFMFLNKTAHAGWPNNVRE